MSTPVVSSRPRLDLPDHKQLPDTDGSIVQNFQELPQSILLTDAILPYLRRRYPDGQFAIGQDCGIYWWHTDPPLAGCKAPDWFYVPGVPPVIDGELRRSYVMWQEVVPPLIVLEIVSGNGSEERDRTPRTGKFWVYEQGIRVPYYGIYEVDPGQIEMHHLIGGRYQLMTPNERGHYFIPELGLELGIWQGEYFGAELPWMRWFDEQGRLLLIGHEIADHEHQRAERERQKAKEARASTKQERQRADAESQRADAERQRAEQLAERLRQLGIDPDKLA